MKNTKLTSPLYFAIFFAIILTALFLLPASKANAAPSQAIPSEPQNKQIIPYYEVWLRWGDVSDEHHYLLSMRDLDTNALVYYNQNIAQNSSHFVIPVNKITRGHTYRWSLCSVDSAGNKKFSPEMYFRIEYGLEGGWDSHIFRTSFASAAHLDYTVYASNSSYQTIIENAVNSWNGISSNVYLHKDTSNTTKELVIRDYHDPTDSDIFGITYLGGMSYGFIDPYLQNTISYVDILLYPSNMDISEYNNFDLRATTLHEVGHALSLAHTNGQDELSENYSAPKTNTIAKTYDYVDAYAEAIRNATTDAQKKAAKAILLDKSLDNIYLVMNNEPSISGTITQVDKNHLKIKWGA